LFFARSADGAAQLDPHLNDGPFFDSELEEIFGVLEYPSGSFQGLLFFLVHLPVPPPVFLASASYRFNTALQFSMSFFAVAWVVFGNTAANLNYILFAVYEQE